MGLDAAELDATETKSFVPGLEGENKLAAGVGVVEAESRDAAAGNEKAGSAATGCAATMWATCAGIMDMGMDMGMGGIIAPGLT